MNDARLTYAKYDESDEQVILHTNKTFLFTRRGILLTSKNLYGKLYDGAFVYPLSSITNISVEIDRSGYGRLKINEKKIGIITYEYKTSFLLNDFLNKAIAQDFSVSQEAILLLMTPQSGNSFLNSIKNLGAQDKVIFQIASTRIEGERIVKQINSARIVLTDYRVISYDFHGETFRYEKIVKAQFRLILPHAHAPHGASLLLKTAAFFAGQIQKQEALSNKKFKITIGDKDYNEFSEHYVNLKDAIELREFLTAKKVNCDYNYKDFIDQALEKIDYFW